MNLRPVLLLTAAVASLLVLPGMRAEADPPGRATLDKLLAATVSDDYAAFTAECDAAMQAALTKTQLAGVSAQFAPHARRGYETTFLGELRQRGYQVQLYRLRFTDGSDDTLATLSLKDGKVGGFYLH